MAADLNEVLNQVNLFQVDLDPIVEISPSTSISKTLELLKKRQNTAAVITENGKAVGIFTFRDILMRIALAEIDAEAAIETVMTPSPITLPIQATLKEVIDLFTTKHYRTVPITNKEKQITGVLTARALIYHIASYFPEQIYNLPPNYRQVVEAQEGA